MWADWLPNYNKRPEYFPRSDGHPKSVTKLTLNEPAMINNMLSLTYIHVANLMAFKLETAQCMISWGEKPRSNKRILLNVDRSDKEL